MMHESLKKWWICLVFMGAVIMLFIRMPYIAVSEPFQGEILFSDSLVPPENIALIPEDFHAEVGIVEKTMEFAVLADGEGIADKAPYVLFDYESVCNASFLNESGLPDGVIYSGTNVTINSATGAFRAIKEGPATIMATSVSNPKKSDTWSFLVARLKVINIDIYLKYKTTFVGYTDTATAMVEFSSENKYMNIPNEIVREFEDTHRQVRWSGKNVQIDPDTGAWTATTPGIATIRATSVSDESIFSEVHIRVHQNYHIEIDRGIAMNISRELRIHADIYYADGTSRALNQREFVITHLSDNLTYDSYGENIIAVDVGQSSITIAMVANPEIQDTLGFVIDKFQLIRIAGDAVETTVVGSTGNINILLTISDWTLDHSDNVSISQMPDASEEMLIWSADAAGPAWVKVWSTDEPEVFALWNFVIYDEMPSSVEIVSVTIDGVEYTGKSNFPNEIPSGAVIVPKAVVTFNDGTKVESIFTFEEPIKRPVVWSGDNVYVTPVGMAGASALTDGASSIYADVRMNMSVRDSWTFNFVGPYNYYAIERSYSLPTSMMLGESVSLDGNYGLQYVNTPVNQQDSALVWTLAPYSVEADIVGNRRLVATHPGMIRLRMTSASNPEICRDIYIWVKTPCCDDYLTCAACSQSSDYHNSALCTCKHNFPFYCPLCKGSCKKYAQPDANGYFHTLVGNSLLPNGAIGIGTTEVRELRVPRGAKASCCNHPCPSCLYSEMNCSGRDCTCGHDFPNYCPFCKGPCKSYRTFGPDGYCHYIALDGRVALLAPTKDVAPDTSPSSSKVCEVCKKYRVDIYDVPSGKIFLREDGLYAGGLACKCKPLFPAYCPYCGGPCQKTRYDAKVSEWHYLTYKPDITFLGPMDQQAHEFKVVSLTGGVIRRFTNVLPGGSDVIYVSYPSLNSSLDGRSDMKNSFLKSQSAYVESTSASGVESATLAATNTTQATKATSPVINLWLEGDSVAFFMDSSLIAALKKQINADIMITAVTGQDLDEALEKALASADPPDAVLLPVEHLIRMKNKWARWDPLIDAKTLSNLYAAIQLSGSMDLIRDGTDLLLGIPMPSQPLEVEQPLDEQSLVIAMRSKVTSQEKTAILRMMEFLYSKEGRALLFPVEEK